MRHENRDILLSLRAKKAILCHMHGRYWYRFVSFLVAVLCSTAGLYFYSCSDTGQTSAAKVYHPQPDSLITMLEAGQLESIHSTVIMTPTNWDLSYQIIYLPEEGTWVQEGDTVVIFDAKQIERELTGKQKELERLQESLQETRLTNQQNIRNLETAIGNLEMQEEIVQNQVEQSRYNSEVEQKSAELELKKTRLNLEKQRESLAAQQILNQNAESEVLLKIKQIRLEIEQSERMISDMYITAPKNGLIVYAINWSTDEKARIGESMRPQSPVLEIPDLENMRVRLGINEVDRPRLAEGIPAELIIEAYPDTVFSGRVSFVSKIVDFDYSISDVKVYNVFVDIHSGQNFRLKPGLSARVTLFEEHPDRLWRVPSWCVFQKGNRFWLETVSGSAYPIDLVTMASGFAFVRGELRADMNLRPNQTLSAEE